MVVPQGADFLGRARDSGRSMPLNQGKVSYERWLALTAPITKLALQIISRQDAISP
jgi:hypothetical protein